MSKRHLIEKIRELDENSSYEDIRQIYMFDLKKQAVLDNQKIQENYSVFEQQGISLEYSESEGEAIKNWLRYKICTKLSLYTNKFDCDATEIVKETIKERIKSSVSSVEYDNDRHFLINNSVELETDTINSFATIFNSYMRNLLSRIEDNWISNYMSKYNLQKTSEAYRYIYFLEMIDKWKKKMSAEEVKIYEELYKLAELVGTIGNFVLVPKGYNKERYSKTADYWDLTLLDLQEKLLNKNYDKNFEWYFDNFELFDMNLYFYDSDANNYLREAEPIMFFDGHSFDNKHPGIKEYSDTIYLMKTCIFVRSILIMMKINPKLNDNKVIFEEILEPFIVKDDESQQEHSNNQNCCNDSDDIESKSLAGKLLRLEHKSKFWYEVLNFIVGVLVKPFPLFVLLLFNSRDLFWGENLIQKIMMFVGGVIGSYFSAVMLYLLFLAALQLFRLFFCKYKKLIIRIRVFDIVIKLGSKKLYMAEDIELYHEHENYIATRNHKINGEKEKSTDRYYKKKQEELKYKQEELEREERAYEYNAYNAERKFKKAKEGDTLIQSEDSLRKEGQKYAEKAVWNAQNAERTKRDIEELERKLIKKK